MVYSITGFRSNTRQALNYVEGGTPVFIERHGKLFEVTFKGSSDNQTKGAETASTEVKD